MKKINLNLVDPSVYEFAQQWVDDSITDGFLIDDRNSCVNDLANQLQQLAEDVTNEHSHSILEESSGHPLDTTGVVK